ncbi:MAG: OmpA family protein [Peptococcaceae bacterium]|nr:OmpA family protein [Peptococcaceae bacterium]
MPKHKKEHHEEHADETWLVPYADILTLLLALFIVLFASSQIDQKKFEAIANAFGMAISGESVFEESAPDIFIDLPTPPDSAYQAEQDELLSIKNQMDAYIEFNGLATQLTTELSKEGLMIRIKETALFPPGSANLNENSRNLATQIAAMLIPVSQYVTVSGHTDNTPINTREFPSNWELSSLRAINFTHLILQEGSLYSENPLSPERFRTVGWGEYHPVQANDTAEGRDANRRVEVLIMRSYRL